jgi:hypothetical protein
MWGVYNDGTALGKTEEIYWREKPFRFVGGVALTRSELISKECYESNRHFQNYKVAAVDLPRWVKKADRKKRVKKAEVLMSRRTKSKIRDKVSAWYFTNVRKANGNMSRVHFNMITLTLTEKTRDHKKVYECLNHFFTLMRKMWGKFNYLWVAEIQDGKRNNYKHATGNLHFHIIVDRYFQVGLVNKMWLKCLGTAGWKTTKIRENPETKKEEVVNLNPVDIKSIGSIGVVKNYITKYVTKNETKLAVSDKGSSHQIWNCSQTISRLAIGMYRVISLDDIMGFYPTFDGTINTVNEWCWIHVIPNPPRSYLDELSIVWSFNIDRLNEVCYKCNKIHSGKCKLKKHGED